MYRKYIVFTPIVFLLLLSALLSALTHFLGVSLKTIMVGTVSITLYVVLIAAYFLRFALIFLGVFAVYRTLRERYDKQLVV